MAAYSITEKKEELDFGRFWQRKSTRDRALPLGRDSAKLLWSLRLGSSEFE